MKRKEIKMFITVTTRPDGQLTSVMVSQIESWINGEIYFISDRQSAMLIEENRDEINKKIKNCYINSETKENKNERDIV